MSDSSDNYYDTSCVNISSFQSISSTNEQTIGEIACICSDQSGNFIYCFATTSDSNSGYIYKYDLVLKNWIPYFDVSSGVIPFSCITTNNLGNVVVLCTNNYYQGANINYQSTIYCSTDGGSNFNFCQGVGPQSNEPNYSNNIIDVTISGLLSNSTNNIICITETECYLYCMENIGSTNAEFKNYDVNLTNITNSNSPFRIFTSVSITNDGKFFAISSTISTMMPNTNSSTLNVGISGIYIFSNFKSPTEYQCIQFLNNSDYPYSFYVSLSSYTSTSTKSTTLYDLTVVASDNYLETGNENMTILYESINYNYSLTSYGTGDNTTISSISNQSYFYDVSGSLIDSYNQFIGFEPSNSGEFQIAFTPSDLFITNNYGVSWYQQDINVLEDGETYTSIGVTNYDPSGLLIFYLGTNQGQIWEIYTDISGVEYQLLDGSNNPIISAVSNVVQKIKATYQEIQSALSSHKSLFNFLMIWPYLVRELFKFIMFIATAGAQLEIVALMFVVTMILRQIYKMVIVFDPVIKNINLEPSGNIDPSGNSKHHHHLNKFRIFWNLGVISTKHKIHEWLLNTFGIEELKSLIDTFLEEIEQNIDEGNTLQVAIDNIITPIILEFTVKLVDYLQNLLSEFREDIINDITKLITTLFSDIEQKITRIFDSKLNPKPS
jgi:hypothetical protein